MIFENNSLWRFSDRPLIGPEGFAGPYHGAFQRVPIPVLTILLFQTFQEISPTTGNMYLDANSMLWSSITKITHREVQNLMTNYSNFYRK